MKSLVGDLLVMCVEIADTPESEPNNLNNGINDLLIVFGPLSTTCLIFLMVMIVTIT